MKAASEVRMDKWLWAVRLYKTRTLAAAACRGGQVIIGGETVRPSRLVRLGEVLSARTGELVRTVRVTGLLDRRVGAGAVGDFLEDLTPASEYLRVLERRKQEGIPVRPKGAGRPTKKERRQLDRLR